MATILCVDDDRGMRELLEILLTQEGYTVQCAQDGSEAVKLCKKNRFDLLITDLKMPKKNGIDLIKELKEISPETICLIITAFASSETAVNAMQEGVYDYLEKNFDIEDLKNTVKDALEQKGIKSNDALFIKEVKDSYSFGKIIGKSKKMLSVYSMIKKTADTSANVLISGESGTGKELVAKAIHKNSSRKNKPFVVINCGGIPEQLLESELFGYVKGAFTGAYTDKPGLFEVALEGTIFLDEIGELPILLQVKLLRAIQEKTFKRVGGTNDITVDVRIIAATNQDLSQKVKKKSFRADLYYRLNVIPIFVPPLRKRKEDIPVITNHFIQKYSKEFKKQPKNMSAYSMQLLMKYDFPGNIRELENIIEKSVALETSNIVIPDNYKCSDNDIFDWDKIIEIEIPEQGFNLNKEMLKIEENLIKKALEKAKDSKTKAAKLLKVSPDSLRYRLEKIYSA